MNGLFCGHCSERFVAWTAIFLLGGAVGCAQMKGPESVSELYEESLRAYAVGDYQRAAIGLAEVVERVPSDHEAWFRLGNAYVRTNRPIAAADAYENAVLRDPKHAHAWFNLSVTRTRIAANSFLQMSRNIDPEDPLQNLAFEMAEKLLDTLEAPAGNQGAVSDRETPGRVDGAQTGDDLPEPGLGGGANSGAVP